MKRQLLVLGWLAFMGCQSSPPGQSTGPQALSLGGSGDDPSLIRALDGYFYLVFISDRTGGNELYVTRSSGGFEWTTPVRVTNNSVEDVFPQLVQGSDGVFHMTWQQGGGSGTNYVYYMHSTDGLSWNTASAVALTSGAVDDRYPRLSLVGSSELRLYFSRNQTSPARYDIYWLRSTDLGATWGAPAIVANVNNGAVSNFLPAFYVISGSSYYLLIQRNSTGDPVELASALFLSTSSDGTTWSAATQLTPNGYYNGLPSVIFAPVAQQAYFTWTSTALATPDNRGGLVAMTLAGSFPSQGIDLTPSVTVDGWSTRVAGSLMVWVSAVSGSPALWGMLNPL